MSYDDNHRPEGRQDGGRERGAYTPPTDDDLPFNRGGFDARRSPPAKAPPVTLIVSALVLLALIIGVVVIYNLSGPKTSSDAPSVGTPVGQLKLEAPIDAQPIDPEAGIDVYSDKAEAPTTAPTFTPPPETAQPRPAPRPLPATPSEVLPTTTRPAPPPRPTAPVAPPVTRSAPTPATPAPTTTPATGASAVQIGAFSSTAIADREFASVAGRFPQFTRGAGKRVQEVTASNGSTVYRTTFTGLSRERAQEFCAAIRSGGGDCLVR